MRDPLKKERGGEPGQGCPGFGDQPIPAAVLYRANPPRLTSLLDQGEAECQAWRISLVSEIATDVQRFRASFGSLPPPAAGCRGEWYWRNRDLADKTDSPTEIGTTWLGLAVASGYAYFGISPK